MAQRVLKSNVKRTVLLDEGPGGTPVVVKRFHAPGALAGLRDRRRAASETRMLRALHEAGLPVPEPLALRRRDGCWELVTAFVADAVPLDRIVAGAAPWPVPPERLIADLARLLARLHAFGLVHRDLHAGNVLVDGEGCPRLVDLARATATSRLSARRRLADLVGLAASVREDLGCRLRARFLAAYLRAAGPGVRRELPAGDRLVTRIEDAARLRRRRVVLRGLGRWTRASSRVVPLEGPSSEGPRLEGPRLEGPSLEGPSLEERSLEERSLAERSLADRGLADRGLAGFLRRDLAGLDAGGLTALLAGTETSIELPGGPDRSWLCLRAARSVALEPAWYAAARLDDHRVPTARPAALIESGGVAAALYELPRGTRPWPAVWREAAAEERRLLARSLGRLLGALEDRALETTGRPAEALLVDTTGSVLVGPGIGIRARSSPSPDSTVPDDLALEAAEREALAEGRAESNRHSRAERREWRSIAGRTTGD